MAQEKSLRRKPGPKKPAKTPIAKSHPPVDIRPATTKIGESDDNLKQRAKWFRQRTADDKDHG